MSRRTQRLRRLAIHYVEHGWPIACIAIQHAGRCTCGLSECVEPHLVFAQPPVITTTAGVDAAFRTERWAIALPTYRFDVVEVPARFGAPLHHQLKAQCPTTLAPATRRWQFFVTPGSIPRDLIEAAGGQVFSGQTNWVVAPGTYTEVTGRIRWLTPPYLTHWQPYQRRDAIDAVFATVDWYDVDAPAPRLPKLVDDAMR
jgi:hypothetical protein